MWPRRYGKFVDSTLDRFVETFAFLGFAVYFAGWPYGPLVVAAGLGFSLLVSYAQARGETVVGLRLGRADAAGRAAHAADRRLPLRSAALSRALGKPEGTVLFWVLVVTAVGAFATAVHRTLWIARKLKG